MDTSYWRTQPPGSPLFPDIEWSRPEQRAHAGKLGIIGGNKLGFAAVAEAYGESLSSGAGQVKVLLPDSLKKSIPPTISDAIFAPSTVSGSVNKEAVSDMSALGNWANLILLIGDAGRNSETAIAYESFVNSYIGPLVVTRDAIDLVKNSLHVLVERHRTAIVLSFAQLQSLLRSVYYPKMVTYSMQLNTLVETLHKVTVTYPITLVTLHQNHLIIAHDGRVVTQPWDNPMRIWRGNVATRAACYWLWSPEKPLEAIATSIATS